MKQPHTPSAVESGTRAGQGPSSLPTAHQSSSARRLLRKMEVFLPVPCVAAVSLLIKTVDNAFDGRGMDPKDWEVVE